MIAEGGRDAFYDGPIARTIDAYFKRIGGWLSADDLREHQAEWVEPLVTKYRGVDVYAMPANTQGLATLQMLNMIENFDMRGYGFQSAQSLQVQIEAKRLAYEDRARYYADPHRRKIPIDWLLTQRIMREGAREADPAGCTSTITFCRVKRREPRRYDVFLRRPDKERHDGVDHPVEFPRDGIRAGGRWAGLHVPGSRAIVYFAGWAPEHLRAGEAAVSDHHSGIRVEGRGAVAVVSA